MNTESARIFGCPSCGAAVTGFEGECPICHFKFGPNVKFECPVCGQHVSPGTKSCPACEVNFSRIAAKALDDAVQKTTEELLDELITVEAGLIKEKGLKFTCPNCSRLLKGDDETCPSCGHKFEEIALLECPKCGAMVQADVPSCPECGNKFAEEKVVEPPPSKPVPEEEMAECPVCGKLVSLSVPSCPGCGSEFEDFEPEEEAPQPTPEPVPAPPSRPTPRQPPAPVVPPPQVCPLCGSPLDPTTGKCPQCGLEANGKEGTVLESELTMLREAPAEPAWAERKCPTCGKPIPDDMPGCSYCSAETKLEQLPASLGAPEPLATEHEEAMETLTSLLDIVEPEKQKAEEPEEELPARASRRPARGLTSEKGKVNGRGLVNGRGAINGRGIVNGRGAINGRGIINGKGAINGKGLLSRASAVNGKGAINGTPFVNGTGVSNGLRPRRGPFGRSKGLSAMMLRWQFLVILVAVAIIIPAFLYISFTGPSAPYSVDGDFDDWSDAYSFGVEEIGPTPGAGIGEWSIGISGQSLFLYVRTVSPMMASTEVESLFLYLDADGLQSTGYIVSSLGADYLLEIDGWNGSVQATSLRHYASDDDQFDWNSWSGIGVLQHSMSSTEIEAGTRLPETISSEARALLAYKDQQERGAVSSPVSPSGGVLIVEQRLADSIASTGIVNLTGSVQFLTLTFKCEGTSGSVSQVSPVLTGCDLASTIAPFSLSPGEEREITVSVDTLAAGAGQVVAAGVEPGSITSTFDSVEVFGPEGRAYVASAPSGVVIDGAFGDWSNRTVPDTDYALVPYPNLDIELVGSANSTDYAYFYVGVQSDIFAGCYVPKFCLLPSGGGGGVIVLPRKTAEDVTRVYVDSDSSIATGHQLNNEGKSIGADRMIQVTGIFGQIVTQNISTYSAGHWVEMPSEVSAANDDRQLELSVRLASLGGNASFEYIVETTCWSGTCDLADAAAITSRAASMWPGIEHWVVDGSTSSSQATALSCQRKMFYDGTNFWSFYWDGSNTVYEYSANGGVTWTSRGSAFTTSGVNKVSIWYDSANNIVYAIGDTTSSSVNVKVKRGTVTPGTATISWGSDYNVAVSTLSMANKNAYICKANDGYLWLISLSYDDDAPVVKYQLAVWKSNSADSVSAWTFSDNMLPAVGDTLGTAKGVIVPAGSNGYVWAIYTYAGNVKSKKWDGSWPGNPQDILQATGTLKANTEVAPPSVVVDSRGVVHVVYGDCTESGGVAYTKVLYTKNNTDAETFPAGTDLDSSKPSNVANRYPTISLETLTGDLYAFWIRTDTSMVSKTIMGKKYSGGSWTSLTLDGESTYTKQHLTSIYSVSGASKICWQWTQNTTSPMEVMFDKIPEFSDLAIPLVFMIALFIVHRRRARRAEASCNEALA